MESKVTVDKLSCQEDWRCWSFQLKFLLKSKGLWSLVEGTEQLAPGASDQVRSEYTRRCERALACIVLHMDKSQLYLVTECETAKEAWEKLSAHFDRSTTANKLYLKKRFYRLQMKAGTKLTEHFKTMKELTDQLAAIGVNIGDDDQVMTLLGSLTKDYDTIVTALETHAEDELTLTYVQQALINAEQKNSEQKLSAKVVSEQGATGAFVSSIICHKCRKPGHIKRECPEMTQKNTASTPPRGRGRGWPRRGRGRGRGFPTNSANAAETEEDENWVFSAEANCDDMQVGSHNWIIDSGASRHMTNKKSWLEDFQGFQIPEQVKLGDGRVVEAYGAGDVILKKGKISNVLLVPKLACNLLSVGAAADQGFVVEFGVSGCAFKTAKGKVVASGRRVDKMYVLDEFTDRCSVAVNSSPGLQRWHDRLGHANGNSLKKMRNEKLADGLTFPNKELDICQSCVEGKMSRAPFPKRYEIASSQKLDIVHSDVCGPMRTTSLGGACYFITFIDDFSRYTKVFTMKTKDQAFEKFKEYEAEVTNQTGLSIKTLRTDGGGEYCSEEFKKFLKKKGILHEVTVPACPEQNGIAERMNRTLVESSRCMMFKAGLSTNYWGEAVLTAAFIRNRMISRTGVTPYERWYGKRPNLRHMRVFGCVGYALKQENDRKKWDKKTEKLRLVGYQEGTKGYRMWCPDRRRILIRRDVVFDEDSFDFKSQNDVEVSDAEIEESTEEEKRTSSIEEPRRTERVRRPPIRYGFEELCHYAMTTMDAPATFKDAMTGPERERWKEAIACEMDSLQKHHVWDLVPLPEGQNVVGCRWIFKKKTDDSGNVDRFKARLVAQGYSQRYGLDYDGTFSPVVRAESVRALIAVAARKNFLLHQMDINTAFLNGNLHENVYMKQPEGFVETGQENLVCKLRKSIYGLKQAPRCWNHELDQHLKSLKLTQSHSDPCIYTASDGRIIVAVYVDDIIVAAERESDLNCIKRGIMERFSARDMGELKHFLGLVIDQKDDGVWIGQPAYTRRVLERLDMSDCKPVATPVVPPGSTSVQDDQVAFMNDTRKYQAAIGSLLYLAVWTRPDISYAVNSAAKHCAQPAHAHWTAVKRILRYLQGTVNYGLYYPLGVKSSVVGYSDSDWAGDISDRKSTSGYIFLVNGTAVSWRSQKQKSVALSTAEAEYMALSSAAQEAIWMMRLIEELEGCLINCMTIMEDNQACISITQNPQHHGRAKHIAIRFHFVRDLVAKGVLKLQYCQSENMIADYLTKGSNIFVKCRKLSGLHENV